MKTKKLLSLCCAIAFVGASAFSTNASAQAAEDNNETDNSEGTCTYYFLAPEDWCMKEYGAENEHVCCYQWYTKEYLEMPGEVMTPAPEIGKNVFKISGVPNDIKGLLFDDGVKYTVGDERLNTEYTSTTETIGLGGFDKSDIDIFKFETCSETSNFNGCIYVLDRSRDINNGWDERARLGSWFPLDEYKKYEQFFGSYPDWYSEERRFGDLDDDESVTSSDALITLRLSVGIDFYNDFTLSIADDDKDGALTSADALALLQISVKA